jgi:hypothetical protein
MDDVGVENFTICGKICAEISGARSLREGRTGSTSAATKTAHNNASLTAL